MSENKTSILVVEDNLLVSSAVKDMLTDENYEVSTSESGAVAINLLKKNTFEVVLLDLMLPDCNGRDLLTEWQKEYPDMPIIFMTAHGDVSTAVECLKSGAYDFLDKPVDKPHLLKSIANAIGHRKLNKKLNILTKLNAHKSDFKMESIVTGKNSELLKTLETAQLVAQRGFSCLLIKGESGTGKGLFANAIHKASNRSDKPFVEVNCSALPPSLIESELFGHIKGAFTDAKLDKIGLFEMADEGILFLDEIGDMDLALQAKLLKIMEEQKFRRVGDITDISVDVAIIAATNQNIEKLVKDGKFRTDLFYRLNVIPLDIPPLRNRINDIPPLVNHFITQLSRKFGRNIKGFSKEAMKSLMAFSWPGNIRELRNIVERGCILSQSDVIESPQLLFGGTVNDFTPVNDDVNYNNDELPPMTLAKAEELVINAAIKKSNGNKNEAARILGVHRTTLYKKLQEYNIEMK